MVDNLIKRIGEEKLKLYNTRGFVYTINKKASPPYLSLKDAVKDIEIRIHNHLMHGGDEKHLITVSQQEPFKRIAFKGVMYETRNYQDDKSGRYIYSGLGDLDTILTNVDMITERCNKHQYS